MAINSIEVHFSNMPEEWKRARLGAFAKKYDVVIEPMGVDPHFNWKITFKSEEALTMFRLKFL